MTAGPGWGRVWTRAVVGPAWHRSSSVWVGTGIVAAVLFGPTAMRPHDLTSLALRVPAVGAVLATTWLLLFLPTARVLVRADGARYLRALPAPAGFARGIGTAAFLALQAPWLILWGIGEGPRGFAIVGGLSVAIAAVAAVQPRARRARAPRWAGAMQALCGMYLRALARRAGDALIRSAGIAILAGVAAGLMIRNNGLVGESAAVLGAAVIAVVLVPGWAGVLLPLVEAHRASTWLARSLGIEPGSRAMALALVIAAVYLLAAGLAVAAAVTVLGALPAATGVAARAQGLASLADRAGWLAPVALPAAAGSALVATRAVIRAELSGAASTRVVLGAVLGAALAVLWLGALGAAGAAAMVVTGVIALIAAGQA